MRIVAAECAGNTLLSRYLSVRAQTRRLCESLEIEDYVVQACDDVSPAKWHLAHTTWFFETMVLAAHVAGYRLFNQTYPLLFNSYYKSLGPHRMQRERGHFSRPTVAQIFEYRGYVDAAIEKLLSADIESEVERLVIVGLNHEQQHQELLLMDLQYNFWSNPLLPAYAVEGDSAPVSVADERGVVEVDGGVCLCGTNGGAAFCYDNEQPEHEVLLRPFKIQRRLVTNAEFLAFVDDGGYENPLLWHSRAFDLLATSSLPKAPLYWQKRDGVWQRFSLYGLQPLVMDEPVSHVSYYEAAAYAQWRGMRLPTEAEWEAAVAQLGHTPQAGQFLESWSFRPRDCSTTFFGTLWQWTASSYLPHPGFKRASGPLGEYNAKFMDGQYVLKGGSFATPHNHIRATYRNYFAPEKAWQFCGIRLAENLP